ncbi:MAG: two-component regulator propeller domain-containing protein [Alistipes finegoldii]
MPDDVLKLYFKSIGIQQGLSHQMVNAIVKDPQGFIWIGTAEGLNRYDGTEFHVYRHEPGNPVRSRHRGSTVSTSHGTAGCSSARRRA